MENRQISLRRRFPVGDSGLPEFSVRGCGARSLGISVFTLSSLRVPCCDSRFRARVWASSSPLQASGFPAAAGGLSRQPPLRSNSSRVLPVQPPVPRRARCRARPAQRLECMEQACQECRAQRLECMERPCREPPGPQAPLRARCLPTRPPQHSPAPLADMQFRAALCQRKALVHCPEPDTPHPLIRQQPLLSPDQPGHRALSAPCRGQGMPLPPTRPQ